MSNNANNSTTGSTGSNGPTSSANHHVASRVASVDSGSSLSHLQSEHGDASSNDVLHGEINAGSEDARIDRALSEDALSTLDNDTIMSDGGELLEFDFDIEIQPLGLDQQRSMARDIKMLQRRLFEATRLSLTMPDDGTLASNAGSLKRQLIMAKENYTLLFGEVVGPNAAPNMNGMVPSDTPYIQWKGHKFNSKKFIFPTMDACFQQEKQREETELNNKSRMQSRPINALRVQVHLAMVIRKLAVLVATMINNQAREMTITAKP